MEYLTDTQVESEDLNAEFYTFVRYLISFRLSLVLLFSVSESEHEADT